MTQQSNARVLALLDAQSSNLSADLSAALSDIGVVMTLRESELTAPDIDATIGTTEIIMLSASLVDNHPALIATLLWKKPVADLWRISSPDEERVSTERSCEDVVIVVADLTSSRGRAALRARIEKRLTQKELLTKMGIIAKSDRMAMIADTVARVADDDISILIVGPSGSGKELVAKGAHQLSRRASKPFVALNCGAIPEGLIESELFGHERGAFTGSVAKRAGYFSQANGGTIFLDEIGEMKPDMQVKLLRALEEGVFYPLGSEKPVRVQVRALAATNRDLLDSINKGTFREDLYYRLAAIKIVIPSLAERTCDIPALIATFAAGTELRGFSAEALSLIRQYHWPGNVRQLRNFVVRMAVDLRGGEVGASDVRAYLAEQVSASAVAPLTSERQQEAIGQELIYRALVQLGGEVRALREIITPASASTAANAPQRFHSPYESAVAQEKQNVGFPSMEKMEEELIRRALLDAAGNRKRAARKLGIGERTLYRKIKRFGLE